MVHDLFFLLIIMLMDIAGNNGVHKSAKTSKDGQIILPLLIEVPQIPIEELKEATDNFGPKFLIGEGSYGHVVLQPLSSLTQVSKSIKNSLHM